MHRGTDFTAVCLETGDYKVWKSVWISLTKKKEKKKGFWWGEREPWDSKGQGGLVAVGKVTNSSALPARLSSSASKSETCLLASGGFQGKVTFACQEEATSCFCCASVLCCMLLCVATSLEAPVHAECFVLAVGCYRHRAWSAQNIEG